MLFSEIEKALAAGQVLRLVVTPGRESGTLAVLAERFAEKPPEKGEENVFFAPLAVTGTAEELDAQFPQALAAHVAAHASLADQVERSAKLAAENAQRVKDGIAEKEKKERERRQKHVIPAKPGAAAAPPAPIPADGEEPEAERPAAPEPSSGQGALF